MMLDKCLQRACSQASLWYKGTLTAVKHVVKVKRVSYTQSAKRHNLMSLALACWLVLGHPCALSHSTGL